MFAWIFYKENTKKVCLSVTAIVFLLVPAFVSAADLSFSPSSRTYEVGDRIELKVLVSGNVSLNAVSGVASVPTSHFVIESISKSTSILNFWVTEPSFSKSLGTVRFEGVALNGFTGLSGTVLTVRIRAIETGIVRVSFQTGQILANDGEGTDITGNLNGVTYTIVEATKKPKAPTPEPIKDTPQLPPTLNAPEIKEGYINGNSVVQGTSDYPLAQVLVTFLTEDGVKIFITGFSDEDGKFDVLIPRSLKKGVYVVTAEMIKQDQTHSEKSNQLILMIGSIFSDMSMEMKISTSFLLIIVVCLLIRMYIYFKKHKKLYREVREAEEMVHTSFDSLKDSLGVYEKSSGLNQDQIASELKKDFKDTEQRIEKEIKDIESL